MFLLLIFAFVSGLVTIAAPCIWPLLPIVLSASSLNGNHKRPLGLTLGILISFGLLTLSISYLVSVFRFDANILRIVAVFIIAFLGFALIIPALGKVFEGWVSKLSSRFGKTSNDTGFIQGFITGLSLGVVWAPCAGPILATIAALSATRAVNFQIILVTVVYLSGIGIPLFIFSYAGQRVIQKSRTLNKYTGRVQKVFGFIMIATAVLIFFNYDKVIEAKLLNLFPSYSNFLNGLEGNSSVLKELNTIKGGTSNLVTGNFLTSDLFNANYPAPQITGITKWLNTDKPLSFSDLKGKVVLVDFWTYTCINCIRTLPFVTSWYDKYKDDGLVVIGVHTPEFEFEHDTGNVEQAIKQFNIHYPVAQDNNYSTWGAFNNQYWPAEYLIDKNGIVRRTHFGEGEYDKSEEAIRELLKETGKKVSGGLTSMPDQTPKGQMSPETYVGTKRMEFYFPNGSINNNSYKNLKPAQDIDLNSFDFGGDWNVSDEYSTTSSNAVLEYNFYANKVFLVMRPSAGGSGQVKVFIDGKAVDNSNAGEDVQNGVVAIDKDRLYNLVNLRGNQGQHLLRLEFSPGIQVFAFTFG